MVQIRVGVDLQLSRAAIEKILTSPAVFDDMKRRADRIAAAANRSAPTERPDEMKPYLATKLVLEDPRGAASVITRTTRGKRDNLRHGTLLKNLDEGR